MPYLRQFAKNLLFSSPLIPERITGFLGVPIGLLLVPDFPPVIVFISLCNVCECDREPDGWRHTLRFVRVSMDIHPVRGALIHPSRVAYYSPHAWACRDRTSICGLRARLPIT